MMTKAWTVEDIEKRLAEFGVYRPGSGNREEARRVWILEKATKHFVRFGYRRANIGIITDDADVGKGTIYRYFASKKALFLACVGYEKLPIIARFEEILTLPAKERLQTHLGSIIRFAATAPLNSQMLKDRRKFAFLLDKESSEQLDEDRKRGIALMEDTIRPFTRKLSDADRWMMSSVLFRAANMSMYLVPEMQSEAVLNQFCDRYTEILVRGVLSIDRD